MRFACWRKDKSVPVRAEVRTLKDAAPSNFSSTPLPERNRGNSYRESGLFCQQFNFFNFFDSFFSLRQPSNPHLLAHGASYVPTLCEIKRQTESNRGNQVDYDCPLGGEEMKLKFRQEELPDPLAGACGVCAAG